MQPNQYEAITKSELWLASGWWSLSSESERHVIAVAFAKKNGRRAFYS
jgi:alkylhydroperoxidase family enzyme